jgi:hypothetical protein
LQAQAVKTLFSFLQDGLEHTLAGGDGKLDKLA